MNSQIKLKKFNLIVKRTFDICSSGAVIAILLPFFILFTPLVALAMRGNPFFVQKRIGKNEKIFSIIKYRTMTKAKDKDGNLLPDAERLTKFGKIMRATSIDELPELFNIFIGQMSVVGPRPLSLVYLPFYSEGQKQRHLVRPGLTGLAQINGRNNLSWEDRINFDLEYIKNNNLFYDLKIIFGTIAKVFKKDDVVVLGSSSVKDFYDEYSFSEKQLGKEIGSYFILNEEVVGNGLNIETDKSNHLFVNSGRNAIKVILRKEKIGKALLPSFTCESVIKAFVDEGVEVEFYNIDKQLKIKTDLLSKVNAQKDKVIVYLQNYFCTYNLDCIKKRLQTNKKVVLIEDITHSLLDNRVFKNADYYVGSIRKWAGVGEGGIVFSNVELSAENENDNKIVDDYTSIAVLQKEYRTTKNKDTKTQFREKLESVEGLFDNQNVQAISAQAKEIIDNTDFNFIARQRAENYYNLWLMFTEFNIVKPVFDIKIGKSIPLFFPVYVENRERMQKFFALNGIYCPIIWPKSDFVKEEADCDANYIYQHILCFPIDQRYGKDDIVKIFKVLEAYSKC
ncbi:MAG: sugar transferase [Clostridia bacterium]